MAYGLHSELTGEIIGAAFEVHNALGPGFLEAVYERALAKELDLRGIPFKRQVPIRVYYKGDLVGTHRLDLLVADSVIVELKAVKALEDVHFAVVRAYLSATGLSVALLVNFAALSLQQRRVVRKKQGTETKSE